MTRHAVAQHFPRARTARRHRVLAALLAVPFLVGLLGAPVVAPGPVLADELSRAQDQQKALERKIAEQKSLIKRLGASQQAIAGQIAQTRSELEGITDDLAATRKKVAKLAGEIDEVRKVYQGLVNDLKDLDHQLASIEDEEAAKRAELGQRKAELTARVQQAYDAERTSLLETFLSGASFTDMLAEMSSQLDAAEQDRALAQQIAQDRETLLQLHRTVEETRTATNTLRQEAGVQKQALDQRMADLRKAQAKLKKLEAAAKAALAAQRARYAKLASDKAAMRRALAATAAAKKKLEKRIDDLVARQYSMGNIPSRFNGTLRWPMPGTVTQPFGCTGFGWEPPSGGCAHFHNGIDIVAPYGTPVRSAAAGRVVYVGWNYADGADPAFIVIVAHSANLTTWYAHLQARYPVRAGQVVSKGQVIGYEGNTGHSTGAHLHWMVWYNGSFVNPRLFT